MHKLLKITTLIALDFWNIYIYRLLFSDYGWINGVGGRASMNGVCKDRYSINSVSSPFIEWEYF